MVREDGCWGLRLPSTLQLGPRAAAGRGELGMRKQDLTPASVSSLREQRAWDLVARPGRELVVSWEGQKGTPS